MKRTQREEEEEGGESSDWLPLPVQPPLTLPLALLDLASRRLFSPRR